MIKTIKQPKLNIAKLMAIGICLLGPYRASAQNQTNIPLKQEIGPAYMTETVAPVQAPFEMPQLQPPQFPLRSHVVKMNEKGLSTAQIQQAIDKLADKGGGTVIIPQGKWETGRITLKSNINLEIQEGAELQFSGLIADYLPTVFTRDEGIEIYSLGACIYANGAENIAITGKGCIKGPSTDCEIYRLNQERALDIEKTVGEEPLANRMYDGANGKAVFLPKTIAPIHCRNVLIEGITIDQGLYWNIVPQYCERVIIRGVTVTSFGHGRTDGIDIDSSRDVLIEYCSLDCQDDCYTIKSGRGKDGTGIGIPSENIVIRYSVANRGAGGIVCGTETAGGIRNVYMHDCVFDGTDQAFRFKTRRTRGGFIENVYIERIRANVTRQALYCDMLGSARWMGELAQRYPAWKADGMDLQYIRIYAVDSKGRKVPTATGEITVEVEGEARLIAMDNGDHLSNDLFDGNTKKLYKGFAMAILRSTQTDGEVKVKINAPGLKGINCKFVTRQH